MIELFLGIIEKYKKYYIIIALQIFLSSILMLTMLCKLESVGEKVELTKLYNGKNMYYFSLPEFMTADKDVEMDDVYRSIDEKYESGRITDLYVENSEDERKTHCLTGFSDGLIRNIKLVLDDGKWFDYSESYKNIPAVAIDNKCKIGEKILLDKQKGIYLEIIGRMSPNEYGMSFNISSNSGAASYDDLFTKAKNLKKFIVPYKSKYFKCLEDDDLDMKKQHNGEILFFSRDVSKKKIISTLEEYGTISNIDDLERNFKEENEQFLFTNGIVLIIFTLLTIAGIGGINCMINIRNQKDYVIYYIYGMSNKQLALMELGRIGFVLFISSVCMIALIKHTKIRDWVLSEGGNLTLSKYLVVLCFMILVFTITTIPFVYKLYKSNLIEMYKQKA
ncbi:hypothetical protein [uncultured Eubacterium sp.]|uniref:hypothetical protein n=1 Tax=uncultured Eubacterium sp. TaxID=165185 RepID=UPI00259ACBAF|nr:hypothetical protein [uncultured Eubacterium sp.]